MHLGTRYDHVSTEMVGLACCMNCWFDFGVTADFGVIAKLLDFHLDFL